MRRVRIENSGAPVRAWGGDNGGAVAFGFELGARFRHQISSGFAYRCRRLIVDDHPGFDCAYGN